MHHISDLEPARLLDLLCQVNVQEKVQEGVKNGLLEKGLEKADLAAWVHLSFEQNALSCPRVLGSA